MFTASKSDHDASCKKAGQDSNINPNAFFFQNKREEGMKMTPMKKIFTFAEIYAIQDEKLITCQKIINNQKQHDEFKKINEK